MKVCTVCMENFFRIMKKNLPLGSLRNTEIAEKKLVIAHFWWIP